MSDAYAIVYDVTKDLKIIAKMHIYLFRSTKFARNLHKM